MEPSTLGPALHDRATRGETLTSAEQVILDEWYATQDSAEAEHLGFGSTQVVATGQTATSGQITPGESAATLRWQIDTLLAQITSVTAQIQALLEQNRELRQENRVLQQKLAQRLTVEAA